MGKPWRGLSSLLGEFLSARREVRRMPQPQKNGIAEREEFQLLPQSGGSVLIGRFQVGDRMILLSHQQWEGDSDLLSERQREEILRRTLVERLRKENPQLKI